MKILDRLPFADRPHLVSVGSEVVEIHRNQIIIWISIGTLQPFPAIIDTGHGHNLSIARRQLERWRGSVGEDVGELIINGRPVLQYAADVHIHRNQPGKTTHRGDSYPLEMPQGISVFDSDSPDAPRLPLIGLRTLVSNRLRLLIDGHRRQVTLRTQGWF